MPALPLPLKPTVEGFDPQEEDNLVDLTEAEEFLRQMKTDQPELFEKIKNLRDGIRSAKQGEERKVYVVCKSGNYHKIYSVAGNKDVVAEDVPSALGRMKCEPSEPTLDLPEEFNDQVVAVQKEFEKHIQEWQAEQIVAVTQPLSQQYVLNQLHQLDREIDDPSWQGQITTFLNVYSKPLTQAVLTELKELRRKRVEGLALVDVLERIYIRYRLGEVNRNNDKNSADQDIPIVVCSMGIG